MPKVTFNAEMCVYIEVLGETQENHTDTFPLARNDGNVISRLLAFLQEEKISYVPMTGGVTGGGKFGHFFYPSDAPKVVQWLKDNGVELAKH